MSPRAPAGAWRLRIFDELPSTSDYCRMAADTGEPEGLAVLARRQTEGRGSRGRTWESPAGNLSLSVLLRPREEAIHAAQWALLAGVAVADVIAPHLPDRAALALKWPNDVLLGGRKLAGILVDSTTSADGALRHVILGIGVNLAVAPDLPDRPTACLAEITPPPSPERFAGILLKRIAHWRNVRLRNGFSPIRAAWRAHAQVLGSPMTIKSGNHVLEGAYAGLGDDGSLLLRVSGAVRAFTTGEVLLGQAPPC